MDCDYKQIGQRSYPIIPLTVKYGLAVHETDALIDSGSLLSLFHIDVARRLGIAYKNGTPQMVASIQGRLLVYIHEFEIVIGQEKICCRVGFSDDFKPALNILGRIDFFEHFTVLFDEKDKKVTLTPYD